MSSPSSTLQDDTERLQANSQRLEVAMARASRLMQQRRRGVAISDFDIRGELYDLAHVVAPRARLDEIEIVRRLVEPQPGEIAVDVAAGSGFLTRHIGDWTGATVYAVDPSAEQLSALRRNAPQAVAVHGFPDDPAVLERLPVGRADFVTSLAGIHHVADQRTMFANIARMMRAGGRFVLADIGEATSVARYFDDVVTAKSLTGHTAQWLSADRIRQLIEGTPLRLAHVEIAPVRMCFTSRTEMALFYRGLHAYDQPRDEVIRDLDQWLGFDEAEDGICVRWPLLVARLEHVTRESTRRATPRLFPMLSTLPPPSRTQNPPNSAHTEWLNLIMFGHSAFQYLYSACELQLFDLLHAESGLSLATIGERLKLDPHPARGLMLGLSALKLVERTDDGGYRNGAAIDAMVRSPDWGYFKDLAHFQGKIVYVGQTDLLESLRTNSNVGLNRFNGQGRDLYHRLSETPGLQETFYHFMGSWSRMSVPKLIQAVDFSRTPKIMDVGGGDATIAIAIARAYPTVEITLLDLPANTAVPRRRIREAGLEDRITVVEHDMFKDPFPEGHDCIMFVHQLVIWNGEQNLELISRAYRSLPSGGSVVIFNSMSNDDEDGPVMSAMDSAYFLSIPVPGGLIYPWKEYEGWLRRAGFEDVARHTTSGWSPHGAVVGVKP